MPKPNTIFNFEKDDLWLWIPVLLGFGAAFYILFEENFLANFSIFLGLFFASVVFYFCNRTSYRSLIFLSCILFLLGCFYTCIYQKIFLSHTKITGKVYVDVVGKIESVKKFYNLQNGVAGLNLVISQPVMYKAKFSEKKTEKKSKKKKKTKKKTKKKSRKNITKPEISGEVLQESAVVLEEITPPKKARIKRTKEERDKIKAEKARLKEERQKIKAQKAKLKAEKARKILQKKMQKNFLNFSGYQEIDRKFLDYSKNYQNIEWLQIQGRERFPAAPEKISINVVKNFESLAVNDLIAIRALLQPPKAREFPDDFDFVVDANFKKIGAFGFALGEAHILKKVEISGLETWFLDVREKIRSKILNSLLGDVAAIALAFLIGDQNQISAELMTQIRNSGLAHLLSISGFHLSLASTICFVFTRFLLSRSQYLSLNFDLKKIAAISAIFGTYFYLKIAASPIPAQRAFLMVLLVLIALFVGEKINSRRAVMTALLSLILFNPYAVFNVSFQLSFAAILVLGVFYEERKISYNSNFWRRFFRYFFDIILLSILVQIATAPFLMHSFQNVTVLGFVANILAIPLTSFLVMPLGFLALFLMPIGLEKLPLLAMEKGILAIEKIAIFVGDLNYSHLVSPQLSGFGLLIAILGLLLICLSKSNLRFVGMAIFLLSFTTIFCTKKPDILFDSNQKFFALHDENGLFFSKKLKPSKQRKLWMEKMGEVNFKTLNSCDETKCVVEKNQKFLVLTARNKIADICKNDFDVIVNLTAKYQLPDCIAADKIKIDNVDFYKKGGQFFYLGDEGVKIKTTF